MYRKLCKYEFKSIGRTLLPIYLAVLAVAIINAFSMGLSNNFNSSFALSGGPLLNILGLLQVVIVFAYFGLLCALFVLTVVIIIQRFYKGLLCDEGYLMFTLPVRTWHLVASKATVALVMGLLSSVTAFLSMLILAAGAASSPARFLFALVDPRNWIQFFRNAGEVFSLWPVYMIELIALCLVAALAALFHIYVSLAIGHLAKKHRIMAAVAAYIAISLIMNFLSGVALMIVGNGLDYWIAHTLTGHAAAQLVIGGLFIWSLLQLAVYFCGTERILSKKLNLE